MSIDPQARVSVKVRVRLRVRVWVRVRGRVRGGVVSTLHYTLVRMRVSRWGSLGAG